MLMIIATTCIAQRNNTYAIDPNSVNKPILSTGVEKEPFAVHFYTAQERVW